MGKTSGQTDGKGAAARHWKMQRLTGAVLAPLMIWFTVSALSLTGAGHAAYEAWLGGFNAALMILLILAMFYHAELGVREVIEDYVHAETVKAAALKAVRLTAFGFGAVSVLAVIKTAVF